MKAIRLKRHSLTLGHALLLLVSRWERKNNEDRNWV